MGTWGQALFWAPPRHYCIWSSQQPEQVASVVMTRTQTKTLWLQTRFQLIWGCTASWCVAMSRFQLRPTKSSTLGCIWLSPLQKNEQFTHLHTTLPLLSSPLYSRYIIPFLIINCIAFTFACFHNTQSFRIDLVLYLNECHVLCQPSIYLLLHCQVLFPDLSLRWLILFVR